MDRYKRIGKTILTENIGVFLFAAGVHTFVAYNKIVPGGITGIATLINYYVDMPIGAVSFLLNLPLLLFGFYRMGKKAVLRTLLTVFELSFMLDIGVAWIPIYQGNIVIAAILGGVFMGSGLSIILLSGTTTGGGDLFGKLIQIGHPEISMGKILLSIDFTVILVSAVVYGEIKYAGCGILTMAICSILVDQFYQSKSKMRMIVQGN